MTPSTLPSHIAFVGQRCIASGSLAAVALAVKHAVEKAPQTPVLIFDNATGRSIDIDTRGTDDDITARFALAASDAPYPNGTDDTDGADSTVAQSEARGRGRPKLGVIAREVTLLPRHWDWLAKQPGGASVALRKLVEDARRANAQRDNRRASHERAYHFMSALAGDLPGFEEVARALFADDRARFGELVAGWPADVRDHAFALGFGDAP
ncbi:MAG: DUF2239 family protein [Pandoraea sp.]|uniref:DUF2239 family protein n=1 Tax=unclassified Pandoraea TaxID=2624094 RepID=UPI000960B21B|nr:MULTISPECIES: DUF2239 family protein [unclassified Pandoraea]MBN9115750.1 DUF2239 family protein [Pandoraea sp.]OJY18856.1 MAG: hypothetical protein BGP02_15615 [Pandoraea sp. 64-18]BDD92860.1 hypothetical protein PanNE5_23000 [Pandoraea sp. NE5]